MLAVFDSGLGGLTVLRALRARLPSIDLLYFADQANVPYGDRSAEDLHALMESNVRTLESLGATAVVMGCNTSCAVAATYGWPTTGLPILDLIESAAADVALSPARRIGVLATKATAASGAYGRAIRAASPQATVIEIGNSELVPYAEARTTTGPYAKRVVERAVAPFPTDLDTLILACTHFPFFDPLFAEALPPGVRRIDPAIAQSARAETVARALDVATGTAHNHYHTTGPREPFARALVAEDLLAPTDRITTSGGRFRGLPTQAGV